MPCGYFLLFVIDCWCWMKFLFLSLSSCQNSKTIQNGTKWNMNHCVLVCVLVYRVKSENQLKQFQSRFYSDSISHQGNKPIVISNLTMSQNQPNFLQEQVIPHVGGSDGQGDAGDNHPGAFNLSQQQQLQQNGKKNLFFWRNSFFCWKIWNKFLNSRQRHFICIWNLFYL